ncbi:MAG: germination protein YpeB [Firmicutes bacterium]|nr:germination protein YpeB [Bacillota bacterium]
MKNWTIPVVALLALGLIAAGYYGYNERNVREQLQVTVANGYRHSFSALLENMENVQVKLAKALVSNTLEQNLVNLSDVWRHAAEAQANLGRLPLAQGTMMRTEKFLSQAGDYAFSLLRKNSMGQTLTEEEQQTLARLRKEADELGRSLQGIQADVNSGKLSWVELHRTANPRLREKSKEIQTTGFEDIEKQMDEYPTLIYDGPFSDHLTDREPRGLTGAEIDEDQAKRKALDFIPENDALSNPVAVRTGEIRGRIPGWSIEVRNEDDNNNDGPNFTFDISRKGGHVISMLRYRRVGPAKISLEQAVERATEFLQSRGYTDMVPTYIHHPDGVAIIPFARKSGDVIIYPDMIKIKVALDNGEILGFEGLQYLMNHHQRDIQEPKITEEDARKVVTPSVEILDTNLAIIPQVTGQEAFCWEFKTQTQEGEPYIFYVDAITGDVRDILLIIDSEDGQLTM